MLFKRGLRGIQIHRCMRAKRHKTASETLLRCCLERRGFFRFFPGLTIFITSRPIRTTNGTKVTSRIAIPVYFAPFASVTFVARLTGLTSASSKQVLITDVICEEYVFAATSYLTNLYIPVSAMTARCQGNQILFEIHEYC